MSRPAIEDTPLGRFYKHGSLRGRSLPPIYPTKTSSNYRHRPVSLDLPRSEAKYDRVPSRSLMQVRWQHISVHVHVGMATWTDVDKITLIAPSAKALSTLRTRATWRSIHVDPRGGPSTWTQLVRGAQIVPSQKALSAHPSVFSETDAENILCVGFGKEEGRGPCRGWVRERREEEGEDACAKEEGGISGGGRGGKKRAAAAAAYRDQASVAAEWKEEKEEVCVVELV
ncbi:hypothetical protein Syun_028188 [Stephania yunnanensis]|uniref:Uncharacterized protein n=1 Tax=Stephania yunnanensis TaxID=152371 RepID=A0AAP0EKA7_9MAGN